MTNFLYRRGDLGSVIVMLLRVAMNENNEAFGSFDEQLAKYVRMAEQGPDDNVFLQNVLKISALRSTNESIAGLMDRARDAIGELIVAMVASRRWHDCGLIDPLHILELAGLGQEDDSKLRRKAVSKKARKKAAKKKSKSSAKKRVRKAR